eukprot:scaffold5812_cov140-Isochrysis_galbana.AAC.6
MTITPLAAGGLSCAPFARPGGAPRGVCGRRVAAAAGTRPCGGAYTALLSGSTVCARDTAECIVFT